MRNWPKLFCVAGLLILTCSQSAEFPAFTDKFAQYCSRAKSHTGTSHPNIVISYSSLRHAVAPMTSCQKWTVLPAKSLDDEPPSESTMTTTLFSLSTIFLPVAGLIFPILPQIVRLLPPNSSEQLTAITVLFVSNRIYLYAMAATIVGLAASRGSTDAPQLGRRIVDLTEELLYRPNLSRKKYIEQYHLSH